MTINNRNQSNISNCNPSKCMSCNFRFVCGSSPYCSIKDNSDSSQINAQLIQRIEELEKLVAGFVNNESNIINAIMEEFKSIRANVDNINNSISKLSNDLDEKLKEPVVQSLDNSTDNISDSNIIPYSESNKKESVIVEKKGLFGRTKWVEEKK